MFMGHLGQIIEGSMKALGFLSGPLVGMFLLGILSRRPNSFGVLIGAACGTIAAAYAAHTNISWLWYGPIGCLATVLIGYPASLFRPALGAEQVDRLTVWGGDSPEAVDAVIPISETVEQPQT